MAAESRNVAPDNAPPPGPGGAPYPVPRLTPWLLLVTVLLALASVAVNLSAYFLGHDYLMGARRMFDLGLEANVPTWFATILLFIAALVLFRIGSRSRRAGDRDARQWLTLGVVFVLLSLDEAAAIHETLQELMQRRIEFSGMLSYSWIIPGFFFVLGCVAYFGRFVWRLRRPIRVLFLMSAAVYVAGALGLELVEGWYMARYGIEHFSFNLLIAASEFLEMGGVVLFIHALGMYERQCRTAA